MEWWSDQNKFKIFGSNGRSYIQRLLGKRDDVTMGNVQDEWKIIPFEIYQCLVDFSAKGILRLKNNFEIKNISILFYPSLYSWVVYSRPRKKVISLMSSGIPIWMNFCLWSRMSRFIIGHGELLRNNCNPYLLPSIIVKLKLLVVDYCPSKGRATSGNSSVYI